MDIVFKGEPTGAQERFRSHASGKLRRIKELDSEATGVDVKVSTERDPPPSYRGERVELTVRSRGSMIRAEATADDRYAALDLAFARLEARLRRAANRRESRPATSHAEPDTALRSVPTGGGQPADAGMESVPGVERGSQVERVTPEGRTVPPDPDVDIPDHMEGDRPLILREKFHTAAPMSIDQALLEMELTGHDFYLFRDADSGHPSVVYRRHGYEYGVLRLIEEAGAPTVAASGVPSLAREPGADADLTNADSRLATLRVQLAEAASAGDTEALLDGSVLAELQRLAEVLDTPEGLEASYALGWLYWYLSLTLPENQGNSALETCLALLTPCFVAGQGELPEPLRPALAEHGVPTAVKLLEEALSSGDNTMLSDSVSLWERIASAAPSDQAHAPMWLSNLGVAFRVRFERTGEAADLDSAIEAGQAAVAALPADHPDLAIALSNLGAALRLRFERTGEMADLDSAIEAGQAAVAALPTDHPDQGWAISDLGGTLLTRYLTTGSIADLNAAVDAARTAADSVPAGNPERAKYLSNLGRALTERFERTGEMADLDSAIEAGQAAVAALPTDHPDRGAAVFNLQGALRAKQASAGS